MKNLATILVLKSKLSRKLQRFNAIYKNMEVSKYQKIVEFPKILIKTKYCETFYEAQTASRLKE